ncbi:MAG: GNAT family N-acetyltransferase, partial [Candidatus Nanopelagicales bacterium]
EGWQSPPSSEKRLDLLRGSTEVILAKDEQGVLIGFVTAITDGVLAASIPLLEVIPSMRGQGVGTELLRRMLERLAGFYMVDVVCDSELVPFYSRFGLRESTAMIRRRVAD